METEEGNKILLRMYLVDGTHKTVFVDPDTTTVEALWRTLCEKLQLPPRDSECFYVFGISRDLELLMYSDTTVSELILRWPALRRQFTRSSRPSVAETLLDVASPRFRRHRRSASKIDVGDAATFQRLPARTGGVVGAALAASPLASSAPQPPSQGFDALALSPRGPLTQQQQPSQQQQPQQRATLTAAYAGPMLTPRGTVSTSKQQQQQQQQQQTEPDFKLVLRPTSVLPIEMELAARSPEAVHLFYLQAVHDTVCSNYPTPRKLAVQLAGLQMQVSCGDCDPALHKPGFLLLQIESYVPEHLRWKRRPAWWEAAIIEEHRKHVGMPRDAAKQEYLKIVRGWKAYGSTFFKAVYVPAHQSFFHQPFQGKVVLGVNRIGVHVIDSKLLKKVSTPVVVCPFDRIVWWDSDKSTFFFEYMPSSKSTATVLLTFKTAQGNLINDLLHDWMAEIENAAYERAQREMASIAAAAAPLVSEPSSSAEPGTSASAAAAAAATTTTPPAQQQQQQQRGGNVLTGASILSALGQLDAPAASSPAQSQGSGTVLFPDPPPETVTAKDSPREHHHHHRHHHHKSQSAVHA